MATRTIKFRHKINGVYVNTTTPPKLRDPSLSFGLALRADNTPVSPPPVTGDMDFPASMVATDVGKYEYDLTDLTLGVEYVWWVEYTYAGVTSYAMNYFTAGDVSDPEVYIFNLDDLIDRFGIKNIAEASNRDEENADINYDTVFQAMLYACSQVELGLPLYAAPLEFTSNVVDPTVREWAMFICMENMFNARGDDDKGNSPYRKQVDNIYREMSMYGTPIRTLPCTRRSDAPFPAGESGDTSA